MTKKKEDLAEVKSGDGLVVGFVDLGTLKIKSDLTDQFSEVPTITEDCSGGSCFCDSSYEYTPPEKHGKEAGLHQCYLHPEDGDYSSSCYEKKDGTLTVYDGDYVEFQVDFCPFCGYAAKTKIDRGVKEDE